MLLANSGGRIVLGSRRDLHHCRLFLMHLLLPRLATVTDRWFAPYVSVPCLALAFVVGTADVACPELCQPIWPACWIDTLDRSSSLVARPVQDACDIYRDKLWFVLPDVVLALWDAVSRSCVRRFSDHLRARVLRPVFLGRTVGPVVPLRLAAVPSWEEACYVFVAGVLDAEPWVAVVPVD